jgi:hypothetical protein
LFRSDWCSSYTCSIVDTTEYFDEIFCQLVQ